MHAHYGENKKAYRSSKRLVLERKRGREAYVFWRILSARGKSVLKRDWKVEVWVAFSERMLNCRWGVSERSREVGEQARQAAKSDEYFQYNGASFASCTCSLARQLLYKRPQ
jgi:hypothetical protein